MLLALFASIAQVWPGASDEVKASVACTVVSGSGSGVVVGGC